MKKLILVLVVLSLLMLCLTPSVLFSADTADVTIDAEGSTAEISNTPSTFDFGTLQTSETSATPNEHFTVTNDGSETCDITIKGTDMVGGGETWTLDDTGAPGDSTIGIKAGLTTDTFDIIVKKTGPYNDIVTGLAGSASDNWHMKLWAPTSNIGNEAVQGTITLTSTIAA